MDRRVVEFLKRNNAVILQEGEDFIRIGVREEDPYLADIVQRISGKRVEVEKVDEKKLEELFGSVIASDKLSEEKLASETPIIRLVNELLDEAIRRKATDIHIEPYEEEFLVRYRIDGVLHTVNKFPKYLHPAVISRIKIMSQLNIAEKRLPQDGKFSFRSGGRDYDIRVSILPTVYGESGVLRILSKDDVEIQLEKLGFSEYNLKVLKRFTQFSNGMILVTGPTGSGKTTTLYALLKLLNDGTRKIITIEDPVEYTVEGVTQVQVNEKVGLTFSKALRSILRQDPDVVMIGEIRDRETAEIAIRASLTGHLVLATLHTNDAPSAFTRLIDMGVESFLVASAVIGVVAQRLVRKVCDRCRISYKAQDFEKGIFLSNGLPAPEILYKGEGCDACNGTGYRGRTVIAEIVSVDDDIRQLVNKRADASEIRKTAERKGMIPLIVDGLKKASNGITTLSEVLRVCNY